MSEYIEKEMSLEEFGNIVGVNDFSKSNTVDIDDLGVEVLTPTGYENISTFVVKEPTNCYQLNDLRASGSHRILFNNKWTSIRDVEGVKQLNETINIVDLEVPNGECYIANGYVNHNTTPGG
jgi:hypothetical protein